MDITDLSGPLYTVHRGDTLHILIGSSSVGSLLSGATADDTSHGEQHGKYDEGVQTITQRNTYHQLATPAYRRNSEQLDTSPCEMTISGPGWNANWRSVQSGKSLSRKHKYTGDQVVAQSADDALRILLGENAKIVPRKRSSATLQTDEKVKGQSAGSFSVRASHNPSAMDDHITKKAPIRKSLEDALKKIADSRQRLAKLVSLKPNINGDFTSGDKQSEQKQEEETAKDSGKSHMDNDKNQTTTMSHEFRSRSKLGQESSKSYDKDIDKNTLIKTTATSLNTKTQSDQPKTVLSKQLLGAEQKKGPAVITVIKKDASSTKRSSRRHRSPDHDSSPERYLSKRTSTPVNRDAARKDASSSLRHSSPDRSSSPELIPAHQITSSHSKQPSIVLNQSPPRTTTKRVSKLPKTEPETSDALSKDESRSKATPGSRKRETKWTSKYQRSEGSPPRNEPKTQNKDLIKQITDKLMKRGSSPTKTSASSNKVISKTSDSLHHKVSHVTTPSRTTARSNVNGTLSEEVKNAPSRSENKTRDTNISEISHAKEKENAQETLSVEVKSLSSKVDISINVIGSEQLETSADKSKDSTKAVLRKTIPSKIESNAKDIEPKNSPKIQLNIVRDESPVLQNISSLKDGDTLPALPVTSPPKVGLEPPLTPLSPSILPDLPRKEEQETDFVPSDIQSTDTVVTSAQDVLTETKPKVEVSTFSLQMGSSGSTDKSPNGDALKSHSSGEVPNQTVHDEDTSGGIETKYDAMPSHNNLPQNTRHHMETNMLNKIVVMNKLDLEPLVETSADDTMNMAPRPVNGEVRLRSRSVPGPVDLGFSVREDPSIMSREEALNHIAQAKAARAGQATEVRSPDTRSPLNVGYPNLTAELIRAKLRQKQENTLNRMANESVRVQYKDTPSTGPIVVETAPDLAPYLFARSTQNEISPDDTLRRLEMLKRRRRCLSTDAASMDDVADDEPEEHIDVSEMYAKTEERVLMDLQKMKVKQQKQQEEISARLARRLNATVSTSGERFDFSSRGVESLDDNDGGRANGDQVESTKPQDENQEISNEYLRSQNIERTAETLDWYRHKRQTAESMCNAKLNRLLSGIDQRYAQFQEDQVGRYISPSSHMAAAVLSGGRTSRPSSRFTSYARRTQSSERIRRYDRDEDEGTRSRFYAGNPFDV